MSVEQKGAYTPPPEPENSFDARQEKGGRGPLLLAVASLVLLAFSVLIWFTYRQGARERGGDTPPRLVADQKPYKVPPQKPSVVQTPDMDKTIYDVLDGEQDTGQATPSPAPEEPLEKPRQTVQITPKDALPPAESKKTTDAQQTKQPLKPAVPQKAKPKRFFRSR